jgi:hypothetical protein
MATLDGRRLCTGAAPRRGGLRIYDVRPDTELVAPSE